MINKIAPDKWKHFFVGIPLGAALLWLALFFYPLHPWGAFILSFGALLMICYGFELFSKFTGKGHYEVMDAVAGIVGGLIGMSIPWFFM